MSSGEVTVQAAEVVGERRWVPVGELPAPERAHRRAELEGLGEQICSLAAQIASATARFLVLLAEYDQCEGWREWGMRSCAHWLSWRCAMSLRTAQEHVRVAGALRELPQTTKSFLSGELSFSKVRAISRVATADTEGDLVRLARHATATQTEVLCRGLRRAARTSGDPEDEGLLAGPASGPPRARYGARWHHDPDTGDLILWGRFSPEEGQVLLAALTRAEIERTRVGDPSDPSVDEPRSGPGTEPEPGGQNAQVGEEHPGPVRADVRTGPPGDPGPALVAMALMTLDGLPVPQIAPAGEVVFVHQVGVPRPRSAERGVAEDGDSQAVAEDGDSQAVPGDADPADLAGPPRSAERNRDAGDHHHDHDHGTGGSTGCPPAGCTTRAADGPALDPATAGLVQCTAHARDVVMRDGAVLHYGRRRRLVSPAQVKALLLRDDGTCQAPGCGRRGFLHAHHVRYWSRRGRTDLDNLILLCSGCHTLVHLDRLRIRALGGQRFEFRDPTTGQVIPQAPPIRGRADEMLYGRTVEPTLLAGHWDGSPLHLSLATSGLLSNWRIQRQDRRQSADADADADAA